MARRQIYAVYKGEENLADGTAEELSKKFGVKVDTLRFWASPASHKRNKGQRLIVIKLGKEEVNHE